MFIIDVVNKLGWAIEGLAKVGAKPTARLWGVLTPNDAVPLREIRRWLMENSIAEGMVTYVPLAHDVVQLYAVYRQGVAKTDAPASISPSPKPDVASLPTLPWAQTSQRTTIPLQKESGTFVVPVLINGALTLKFTIDSGAADVSIPADVVITLIRTGTITDKDLLGTQTYRLADGSRIPSQNFRIRSLKIGDRVLENIVGSVAPVAGSLLLGQSFLSRFKSWSIDNERQVLVLE